MLRTEIKFKITYNMAFSNTNIIILRNIDRLITTNFRVFDLYHIENN